MVLKCSHTSILSQDSREKLHYESVWSAPSAGSNIGNQQPQYLSKVGRSSLKPILERIHRNNRGQGKGTTGLLDVGCGNGRNSFLAASIGFSVDALDISSSAIELAKNSRPDADIRFLNTSFFEFAAPDEGYAAILDDGFFHHLRPACHEYYVEKIRQLLRPDTGRFILVHLVDTESNRAQRHYIDDPNAIHFTRLYKPENINEIFSTQGFTTLKVEPDADASGREFSIHLLSAVHD